MKSDISKSNPSVLTPAASTPLGGDGRVGADKPISPALATEETAIPGFWAPPSAAVIGALAAAMGDRPWRAAHQKWRHLSWVGWAVAEAYGIPTKGDWRLQAHPLIRKLCHHGVLIRTTTKDDHRRVVPAVRIASGTPKLHIEAELTAVPPVNPNAGAGTRDVGSQGDLFGLPNVTTSTRQVRLRRRG